MRKTALLTVILLPLACLSLVPAQDAELAQPKPPNLAPYYPTPTVVVKSMLELGELKPGELLYDLGSGDGRIVIMAGRNLSVPARWVLRSTGGSSIKAVSASRNANLRIWLPSRSRI